MKGRVADLLAGGPLAADADRIATGVVANRRHARLHVLASYRPRTWHPQVRLLGREHVEQALSVGRGVVLWIAPFVFSDLLAKLTFHAAGFSVVHLSRADHGFSPSRFAARTVNPIWIAAENRYLAERLVMADDGSVGVLRAMMRRLGENRLLSIAISRQGLRTYRAPFFAGSIEVAQGAPLLACRTGAALLPVFTVRTADGAFVTTVEPPLRPSPSDVVSEREAVAVADLVAQYGPLLESYALRWPDQCRAWHVARPSR